MPTEKDYERDGDQNSRQAVTTSATSDVQPQGQLVDSKYIDPVSKENNTTVAPIGQTERSKQRKSNLEPVDPFDEEYGNDYEHDAGKQVPTATVFGNTSEVPLPRPLAPKIQSELALTTTPQYQKTGEKEFVTASYGASHDDHDWDEKSDGTPEQTAGKTPVGENAKQVGVNDDEADKHKSRVLSIALGEPPTIVGARHEEHIPRPAFGSRRNGTSTSSRQDKLARVLNIYLNSVVKPSLELANANETVTTTAIPTAAPEEPLLKKESLLGPSDLVLRPQFDSSAESAKDLLATFTRSQRERISTNQTSRNSFHSGSSTKMPAVRSVKKAKLEKQEAEAVQKETVLLPSITQERTAEITPSIPVASSELASSCCSFLKASVSVSDFTTPNDQALSPTPTPTLKTSPTFKDTKTRIHMAVSPTKTPVISSSFSSIHSRGSTASEGEDLGRLKSGTEGTPLYDTSLLPTPTPKLAQTLSTRNFDNDDFPTCQNTCFWTIVRRSKLTSSLENIATNSLKGAAVSATPVPRASSSTASASDLLSPTLVTQSARSPKGKRAKAESGGRRTAATRSQKASPTVSAQPRNETATLEPFFRNGNKSDQSSDLGTEESRQNSSSASLPSSRTNSSRESKKRESKKSPNHSSERLSSDVREILGTDFSLFGLPTPSLSPSLSYTSVMNATHSREPLDSSFVSPTPSLPASASPPEMLTSRSGKNPLVTLRGRILVLAKSKGTSTVSSATNWTRLSGKQKTEEKNSPTTAVLPSLPLSRIDTSRATKSRRIIQNGYTSEWRTVKKSPSKKNNTDSSSSTSTTEGGLVYATQVHELKETPRLQINSSLPDTSVAQSASTRTRSPTSASSRAKTTSVSSRKTSQRSGKTNASSKTPSHRSPTLSTKHVASTTKPSQAHAAVLSTSTVSVTKSVPSLTPSLSSSLVPDRTSKNKLPTSTSALPTLRDTQGTLLKYSDESSKPLSFTNSLSNPRTSSLSHTHLSTSGYASDVRSRVAPTPTMTQPRSVSTSRQAKLDNSFTAKNDHVYVEDEDAYLLDGDHSPNPPGNDSSSQIDVSGNYLREHAKDPALTFGGSKPMRSQDDEDPSSREQDVSLPPAAVPIDPTGNSSYNSDVSDDELSVEGPTAPDPTNEATGPEFTRPMPLWPFLAPLLLLLFLPPAVWCLLRPEKLPPPPMPPPPPPPMPPAFHSWGHPSY